MPSQAQVSGITVRSTPLPLTICLSFTAPQQANAQRMIPKLQASCPMGYVDTSNGKCSTLGVMTYTVAPRERRNCPQGWISIGSGYCRKK